MSLGLTISKLLSLLSYSITFRKQTTSSVQFECNYIIFTTCMAKMCYNHNEKKKHFSTPQIIQYFIGTLNSFSNIFLLIGNFFINTSFPVES